MIRSNVVRRRCLGSVAALALGVLALGVLALGATGCKSQSPCSPPPCLAEPPATTQVMDAPRYVPPPRPYAAMPAPAPMPAPVLAAPQPDPDQQARLETLRTALEAQQRKAAELEAQNAAASKSAEDGVRRKASLELAAQQVADELRGVPGAQVMVEGASVVVVFTEGFDSGSDKLRTNPDLRAALKATSMAIARHPEAKVAVVGHTDGQPITKSIAKWSSNTELSKARAAAVAGALSSDGVPRDRILVDGKGESDPMVSPEKTAADRARNRRVEVSLDFSS